MEKRYIVLNTERCTSCYACTVACIDEHYDIDDEYVPLRTALKIEDETGRLKFISIGCMHCDENPCITACPTGAIFRDKITDKVTVDSGKCIGCHSCLMTCPYGAPKFTSNNKMTKCDGCNERLKNGEEPSCVRVCPSKALSYLTEKEIQNIKYKKILSKI